MANKIKIRRGLKANLPTLSVGEQGLCTDTSEVFIGGNTGNIQLTSKQYVDSQLAQIELDVTDLLENKSIHSSGENANGRWIRFQDGTQICHRVANFDGLSTINQAFAFPASFIELPTTSASRYPSSQSVFRDYMRGLLLMSSQVEWFLQSNTQRPASFSDVMYITLGAIGRWK